MSELVRHKIDFPQDDFYCRLAPAGAEALVNEAGEVTSVKCQHLMTIQDMCRVRCLPYSCLFPRCTILHSIPDFFKNSPDSHA